MADPAPATPVGLPTGLQYYTILHSVLYSLISYLVLYHVLYHIVLDYIVFCGLLSPNAIYICVCCRILDAIIYY